jgi:hypothetical protein
VAVVRCTTKSAAGARHARDIGATGARRDGAVAGASAWTSRRPRLRTARRPAGPLVGQVVRHPGKAVRSLEHRLHLGRWRPSTARRSVRAPPRAAAGMRESDPSRPRGPGPAAARRNVDPCRARRKSTNVSVPEAMQSGRR